jgi:small ligand-binding sensory domain FIST
MLQLFTSSKSTPLVRTALSQQPALEHAVTELSQQLSGLGEMDLALVFASSSYASDLPRLLPLLQKQLRCRHWLGACGGGVVGTNNEGSPQEVEAGPALSLTLMRLPGATITPFQINLNKLPDLDGPREPWIEAVGADPEAGGAMVLLIDPASSGINDLISGLDYGFPAMAKLGGLAGQHSANHGALFFDQQVCDGAVGCVISGAFSLDPLVAQGCRPIGPIFEVAQAQRNVLLELRQGDDLKNPLEALQGLIGELSSSDRELLRNSLFVGLGKESFSLPNPTFPQVSPFLVRNLMGMDPRLGAIAVADRLRVGQQLQFQLRDGNSSRQELKDLLQIQQQHQPNPLATLLFACLGRGHGLYGEANVDVGLCRELFPNVPMAGLFCNGEIGPVAGSTQLHGYTASWAFLVPNPLDQAK